MIVTLDRDRLRAKMTTRDAALPSFGLADGSAERRFPTGRSTLLCFVKEDCPTCRLSMPLIREMQERYGEAVDVWAVGQDAAGNAVLMDEYGLPGPMLDDSGLGVSYAFAIDTVPTLILTDGAGREQRRFHGFGRDDFRDMTTELSRLSGLGGAAVDWESYPVSMPGCGSKSMEPGIYERLKAEAEGSPIPSAADRGRRPGGRLRVALRAGRPRTACRCCRPRRSASCGCWRPRTATRRRRSRCCRPTSPR